MSSNTEDIRLETSPKEMAATLQRLMEETFQRCDERLKDFSTKEDEARPLSRYSFKDIVLESDTDIDYSKLLAMLSKGRFRQADKLTYDLMCKAMSKPVGSYFTSEDISYFPDSDLLTINKLWDYYSNGKFGFSAQREQYRNGNDDLDAFKRLAGWKEFIFQDNNYPADDEMLVTANDGFLPYLCNYKGKVLFITNQIIVHNFISRLDMVSPE
jgi:GUN4-like